MHDRNILRVRALRQRRDLQTLAIEQVQYQYQAPYRMAEKLLQIARSDHQFVTKTTCQSHPKCDILYYIVNNKEI